MHFPKIKLFLLMGGKYVQITQKVIYFYFASSKSICERENTHISWQGVRNMTDTQYILNTFLLLFSGALVFWMAAGFAMLESGLVRTKNTTAILTKNICLYSLSCIIFFLIGYQMMYGPIVNGDHSGLSDFFFKSYLQRQLHLLYLEQLQNE